MITIGEIVAVHGIRGQVRVALYTDFPERFDDLDEVYVTMPGGDPERYRLTKWNYHPTKALLLLSFAGVGRRETAEKLIGGVIEVSDDQAVDLPEGVYFQHEIIGLSVKTTAGRELGPVTDVLRTGANDVYVTANCLIPAIADVVKRIDLDVGEMIIEAIPGLLEDED